jgi:hypothetical protein
VSWLQLMLLAAAPAGVSLSAEGCPPGMESELRRLLTIELKVPVTEVLDGAATRIAVRCERDRVAAQLQSDGHAPETVDADTSDLAPLAVPRAVALVVAEAVGQLWRSPRQPAPEPEVVAPVAPPPTPAVTPARFHLALLGAGRAAGLLLVGGGVAFDMRLLKWLGLRADVEALHGRALRAGGQVWATQVDGGVTLDARAQWEHWLLRAGLGLRVGQGALGGLPAAGRVAGNVRGLLWGPQLGERGLPAAALAPHRPGR